MSAKHSRHIQASPTRLLKWAIRYVEEQNNALRECHTVHETGEIRPYSVKREVESVERWLKRAREAVK